MLGIWQMPGSSCLIAVAALQLWADHYSGPWALTRSSTGRFSKASTSCASVPQPPSHYRDRDTARRATSRGPARRNDHRHRQPWHRLLPATIRLSPRDPNGARHWSAAAPSSDSLRFRIKHQQTQGRKWYGTLGQLGDLPERLGHPSVDPQGHALTRLTAEQPLTEARFRTSFRARPQAPAYL